MMMIISYYSISTHLHYKEFFFFCRQPERAWRKKKECVCVFLSHEVLGVCTTLFAWSTSSQQFPYIERHVRALCTYRRSHTAPHVSSQFMSHCVLNHFFFSLWPSLLLLLSLLHSAASDNSQIYSFQKKAGNMMFKYKINITKLLPRFFIFGFESVRLRLLGMHIAQCALICNILFHVIL